MSEVSSSNQQEKMVKGMAWLTAGNFLSRLLGIVYIIPWFILLGKHSNEANALFNMGYQIYANFLLISTVGLPTAVAKQVAKYNSLDQKETSFYLVREFLKLMVLIGVVCAAVMYLTSPWLAELSGDKEQLTPVMYSLVAPVLLFPVMSVMRGFFQGLHQLKPYAVSQIAEQIFRVIWILVATFMVMKVGSGDYLEAVIQSTFAAFVGMVASIAVLVHALYKEGLLSQIFAKKPSHLELDIKGLIIETLKEAVPVIILGSAIQLYQFIDQITFVNVMKTFSGHTKEELLQLYSYMVANPSKITMLLIAVTGSIGGASIALITESFVQKDKETAGKLIVSNFQMLALFILPAVVGASLLTESLYVVFYGKAAPIALVLFVVNLLQVPFWGMYTVLEFIIQAVFENKKGMLYFAYGLVVKALLQIPAIYLFQSYGPLIATAIGMTVSIVLMYRRVQALVGFHQRPLVGSVFLSISMTALMAVLVGIVEWGLTAIIPVNGRLSSIVHLVVAGSVGVLAYLVMSLKTRQADGLLGRRAQTLRRILRIS